MKADETWRYSTDGGATFKLGTGGNFTLDDDIYVADTIQIEKLDAAGNTLSITKVNELSSITIDTMKSVFTSPTTVNVEKNTAALTTIYTAVATDDNIVAYTLKSGFQKEKFTINAAGELKYKEKQTQTGDHKVTIIATDSAGNETEQLITVSVKKALSTSIAWSGIGDDNKINANEMAATTLSGIVETIGTVTSISISSIAFKQGNTAIHTISNNLPSVNSDNTWTLGNDSTWTSKLTQGDYTVTVYLSGNGGSVTDSNSITTAIDTVKPAQPAFSFEDTGLLNNDGISNNGVITINNLEVNATWQYSISGDNGFVDGTGSSFTLANNTIYVANAIQVRQTDAAGNVSDIGKNALRIVVDNTGPIFDQQPTAINVDVNILITTTVYDAQASNLNGGNADEGITYRIKGTNVDKFAITDDTGILTYKAIQTSVHNDTVTIVATDVAGNETEQLITVSVKILARGFIINGKNAGDKSGFSVSNAGDVNGDGLDDLIVGAHNADPSGKSNAGKSYIIFGKIDSTAINLFTIASGTGGFVINGETEHDISGYSVSTAGDVNGDGLDDLIVGAHNANSKTGKSYIIFGKKDSTVIELSAIASGTGGFVINGEHVNNHNGFSVSTAGDVNGDGLDDLIVASPLANQSLGKSYVIFGKIDSSAINLSAIGTGGFVINSENGGDSSGWSTSNAGDVNGDGLDDLIVSSPQASVNNELKKGKAYVVFGKKDNTAINLSAIASGTGGFVINGENRYDNNGTSVSTAGDVNGDGLDDLIVGAKYADPNNKESAGKSYVVFGKKDSTAVNLSAIGTGGFVINGENAKDFSGISVSDAGDVNGDGLDDLIVGAHQDNLSGKENAGKSYVVFGKTDNTAIDLSAIASGTGGFVINGENVGDESGISVSSAGDVNGDGLDDLIVGAHQADPGKINAGKSYVIFGKTDNTAIDLSAIASGTGGFVINGENASDWSGNSVSSAGDVNGDGLDDLIVGAPMFNLNGENIVGKSYVIFGKTDTNAIDLANLGRNSKYAIDYLGDENANTLTGTNSDEIFVAGAGDDTLTGNGGMDVLNAGAGNDTITISASNIAALAQTGTGNRARVDGGGNIDTLKLDGSNLSLDLTNISNTRIQDIEKIDITGSGNNALILNLNDLLDTSTSTNILKVLGNSNDAVNASGFAKISSTETEDNITYDVYTHNSANTDAKAALWIQQDIDVTVL
ncbi:Flagellar hook-length control protein FliK [Bathymodiolus brooksi thiotrophic gill symbiont]|nr:Flagellar hook-length control protein FliK [Bathymodiolus brooksi thiotrophic gill symbiont]